ncbi:hypothetical protein P0Y35_14535 [Kiritimatiellaeota bacterium B1221]|nr:hypothetical protein [Kiritimatiellaeota bacterium B1221]
MNRRFLLTLTCSLIGFAFAQVPDQPKPSPAPPPRDADLALIQAYNMEILETQAKIWEGIAAKTADAVNRDMYYQVAANYRQLKAYSEEFFITTRDEKPFHYEKLHGHQHRHNKLLEIAVATYGEKIAPVVPPKVRPQKNATPTPETSPLPASSYTTQSGFEVKLKLEN